MESFSVIPALLNVRSVASAASSATILTQIARGKVVEVTDKSLGEWWKVKFVQNGRSFEGFVKAAFLEPATPVLGTSAIKAVHFPAHPLSKLTSTVARHCLLNEPHLPQRDPNASAANRANGIQAIVTALNPQNTAQHLRYAPANGLTFCNIYAYDFCCANGVYLPRVWWTPRSLIALSQGQPVAVVYDETVRELRANDLYDWLVEWGDDFGWTRTFDLDILQARVNEGAVGLICGKRRNTARSGHIVGIVPELPSLQATRQNGHVTSPVQTQAGARNRNRFADSTWWLNQNIDFVGYGFWWHA
jgi:hypothetical protein